MPNPETSNCIAFIIAATLQNSADFLPDSDKEVKRTLTTELTSLYFDEDEELALHALEKHACKNEWNTKGYYCTDGKFDHKKYVKKDGSRVKDSKGKIVHQKTFFSTDFRKRWNESGQLECPSEFSYLYIVRLQVLAMAMVDFEDMRDNHEKKGEWLDKLTRNRQEMKKLLYDRIERDGEIKFQPTEDFQEIEKQCLDYLKVNSSVSQADIYKEMLVIIAQYFNEKAMSEFDVPKALAELRVAQLDSTEGESNGPPNL